MYDTDVITGLLFFSVPRLLSPDVEQRTAGYEELTTVIFHARAAHLLHPPAQPHVSAAAWKKWIQEEGTRRTVWILYLFDSFKTIDTGGTPLISPRTVGRLVLPAPDAV